MALMITLSSVCVSAAPKHRHHPRTEAAAKDTASRDEGIEAFSDTTSSAVAESQDSIIEEGPAMRKSTNITFDDDDFDDFGLRELFGITSGVAAIVILAVVCLLFIALPLVILILIIRYFIKRHNDRVMLAEKAMEAGQSIPESLKPVDKQSPAYLYKRGVTNLAIGIGLALMFLLWGSRTLAGVGVLVACYGFGQLFLSWSNKNNDQNNNPEAEA